jgi:isoleucyl-tRNA synthetase
MKADSHNGEKITPQKETTSEPKTPASLREEEVLAFWDKERIFEKTLKSTKNPSNGQLRKDFVFYDGPPYATGTPHFGHLLPSTIKDAIPRYKTMRGFHVSRRWGWDCHGLPIENLIEKELGLADKKAIIDYGIDRFNKAARDSVFRYDQEWKKVIHRMGRWVDMENNYQTMDSSYTESVWWSFAEFFKKGLVYEGFKTMQICPRCETTLSNFEVGQGYADVQDISVYVMFPLKNENKTYLLAWTTTPWTLHGNVALAVNPELTYVKAKLLTGDHAGKTLILAEARLSVLKEAATESAAAGYEIVEKMTGSELAAMYAEGYAPVFDTYSNGKNKFPLEAQEKFRDNAWKIQTADFVTADSGTGIVHIAPAFGDDDRKLADANGLPMIHHVGLNGHARPELGEPFAGRMVKPKDAPQSYDIEVIKALAHAGAADQNGSLLYAKEKITHSYPHCWRCGFPLLNYSTSGWFIETTKLQNRLIEENNRVNWVPPEIGSGRFGSWLENVRDWNLSRSRFWGAPLPVWRGVDSGRIHVLSSIAELKAKIKKRNSYTLMRHGESESNVLGIISSKDVTLHGLTDLGRQQVAATIAELKANTKKKITKIYASDFRRTRETAEFVADAFGIDRSEIVFDHRLGECSGGILDGKTWGEHWSLLSTPRERLLERVAEGESVLDVKIRATQAMYDIDAANEGEEILVVTHGLPLRLIKYASLGRTARDLLRTGWQDISDPNASLHDLDWRQLPHNETWELDIHRPYVDEVIWNDEESGEKMIRIPEVFDVWYDSGAMPFAQNHYPFEHAGENISGDTISWNAVYEEDLTKAPAIPPQFPADFIAEGLDQTRGWFYSLLTIGVGLFDQSPYRNVMVNGLILAEDGRKMSKSLRNYPDLWPTIQKYGADSLRFFLASSPAVRGEEVAFSEKNLDEVNKKIFNRIENMHSFLTMYAVEEKGREKGKLLPRASDAYDDDEIAGFIAGLRHPLDLWVMARLNQTIDLVTTSLDRYLLDKATRPIADLIDDVSTWYLRRSRDRFKTDNADNTDNDASGAAAEDKDKDKVSGTTPRGSDTEDRDNAIFTLRFVLERLSRIMTPVTPFMAEHLYKKVRFGNVESVNLMAWPEVIAHAEHAASTANTAHIIESMGTVRELVEGGLAMRSEFKIKVRQPLSSFTYVASAQLPVELEEIIRDELNVKKIMYQQEGIGSVLDTNVTPELRKEGAVRDLIRAIQQERKNQNLMPQDSISIIIAAKHEAETVIREFSRMIEQTVTASDISFVSDTKTETDTEIGKGIAVDFIMDNGGVQLTDTVRFLVRPANVVG